MKTKTTTLFWASIFVLGSSAMPLAASPITFNFAGGGDYETTTHVFGPITASGFDCRTATCVPTDLFGKGTVNGTGSEDGLGLEDFLDHEIVNGTFIQLSVPSLANDSVGITMGSVSGGEGWAIYGTNSAGTLSGGHLFASGDYQGASPTFSLGAYQYLDVTETTAGESPNVLVNSLTATSTTPEPATFGLIGFALAGLGLVRRLRLTRG